MESMLIQEIYSSHPRLNLRETATFLKNKKTSEKIVVTELERVLKPDGFEAPQNELFEDKNLFIIWIDGEKKYLAVSVDTGETERAGFHGDTIYVLKIVLTDLSGNIISEKRYTSPGGIGWLTVDKLVRQIESFLPSSDYELRHIFHP